MVRANFFVGTNISKYLNVDGTGLSSSRLVRINQSFKNFFKSQKSTFFEKPKFQKSQNMAARAARAKKNIKKTKFYAWNNPSVNILA